MIPGALNGMRARLDGPGRWRSSAAMAAILMVALVAATPAPQAAEGVPEPEGYKSDNYRSPVPRTLQGAKAVLSTDTAKELFDQGGVFVDVYPRAPRPANLPASTVWREPPHKSIEGAHWLPNVGYGVISPETQAYFASGLERLTSGDKKKPIVFFCLRDCWMSWNAAKRALTMGYAAVYWYPDGSDGWEEWGYPTSSIVPAP